MELQINTADGKIVKIKHGEIDFEKRVIFIQDPVASKYYVGFIPFEQIVRVNYED